MKTIFVLIICSSLVFGQTWDGGSRTKPIKGQLHFFPEGGKDYPKLITLQDLLDYEKECYADSSFEKSFQYWRDDDRIITIPDRWVHREPTFKGFIEFLRSRNPEQTE